MRIHQIYNEQRSRFGGEPAVIEVTTKVLEENGHSTRLITKSSRALENSFPSRIQAGIGGVYSFRTKAEMRRLLQEDSPDLVHVHSVYPMFSPSVIVACKEANIPVVMTVHTHNLTCPTWYHLNHGKVCEACMGGHEYHCVLKNCRNNFLESSAYALRSLVARRLRLFHDNVDVLIALTTFSKGMLMRAGFREDQVVVVPNPTAVTEPEAVRPQGEYVAFAGRISAEKGLDVLIKAAALMPDIPFKVAGDGDILTKLAGGAPANVEFFGKLGYNDLLAFYRKARFLVVPSVWYEPFGMVVADAMALGLPVIASRIGGLPDVVLEEVTGVLFEAGNVAELTGQIRRFWNDSALCARMGRAGQQRARSAYSRQRYYENLLSAYTKAMAGGSHATNLFPILPSQETAAACK